MNTKIKIGLFGFGTVGGGLFHVLEKANTKNIEIVKICIKSRDKIRDIDLPIFTYESKDILDDSEINLVVELIDDSEAAYKIVKQSLLNGKSVVSGNKKMLAEHLEELIELQKETNTALLYDASACGSIPIIRNLEEYYDNDLLKSVTGILNGSSNYILTKMFSEKQEYADALAEAQRLGFAESNPTLDVEGLDSLNKLVIIAVHSIGVYVHPSKILNYGIPKINADDINYALEKGKKFKLVGQVLKVDDSHFTMFVLPKLVNPDEYIYNVEDEYNGVVIEGECYDKQFMFGKGAGAYPTGSAILSDITARLHNYKYEYKKKNTFKPLLYTTNISLEIYLRYNNTLDISLFDFEEISEKYSATNNNYIKGYIKLDNLITIKHILPKLNVFLATTGNYR